MASRLTKIISKLEQMVGLYGNDCRETFEAQLWLAEHDIKMSQQTVDKLIAEVNPDPREGGAPSFRREVLVSEDARKWTIAGIFLKLL